MKKIFIKIISIVMLMSMCCSMMCISAMAETTTNTTKDAEGNTRPYHLGHFFIAIDTNHFLGEEIARKKAGDIIRSMRASKKAPGEDRIYTAGEKEYEIWMQRKDSGVPINESVQAEMNKVRDDLGLDYKFPWEA